SATSFIGLSGFSSFHLGTASSKMSMCNSANVQYVNSVAPATSPPLTFDSSASLFESFPPQAASANTTMPKNIVKSSFFINNPPSIYLYVENAIINSSVYTSPPQVDGQIC